MIKLSSIILKRNIKEVFLKGTRFTGTNLSCTIQVLTDKTQPTKFLLAVNKKIRIKPLRNTIKRRLRVIVRALYNQLPNGLHIALMVHNECVSLAELNDEIVYLLNKYHAR